MTDKLVQNIQDNTDRVFFPFLGKDNIFTHGIKLDKTFLRIGNFEIYWYGFLIALGALLAMLFCFRIMKKFGINPDKAVDSVIFGFVGAVIGARLYFVLFSWNKYVSKGKFQFMDAINIRDGGLAIYGGIIAALIVGGLVTKHNKIRVSAMFDVAAFGLLIGQAIGRWGNFFNQEAYGSLTKLPWGMTSTKIMDEIAPKFPATPIQDLVVHPCFLYESLWCILGFILLNIYRKHRKFDGEIFLMYVGWYGLGRAFIEGLRTDSLMIGDYLRVSQMLAIACVVVSVAAIAINRLRVKDSGNYQFYYETEISKKMIEDYDNPPAKKEKKKIDKDLTKVIDNAFDDEKTDKENLKDEKADDDEVNMKVLTSDTDDDDKDGHDDDGDDNDGDNDNDNIDDNDNADNDDTDDDTDDDFDDDGDDIDE